MAKSTVMKRQATPTLEPEPPEREQPAEEERIVVEQPAEERKPSPTSPSRRATIAVVSRQSTRTQSPEALKETARLSSEKQFNIREEVPVEEQPIEQLELTTTTPSRRKPTRKISIQATRVSPSRPLAEDHPEDPMATDEAIEPDEAPPIPRKATTRII